MAIRNDDEYLGDGLYASFDGWRMTIYMSDGIDVKQAIRLEPAVLAVFLGFLSKSCPEQFNYFLRELERGKS